MSEFLKIVFQFSKNKIHDLLDDSIRNKEKNYICVVDTNILMEVRKNDNYLGTINNSLGNLCDSSWVSTLYNLANGTKTRDYKGPDFFLDVINKKKYSSFFLGSTNEVLLHLKKFLNTIDSNTENMEYYSPPFLDVEEFNYPKIAEIINNSGAQVVWVGLGAPKQEKFMERILPYINSAILVGVGAAFVLCSEYENFKRAPQLLQKLKLEWLYRIYMEPKKQIKRMSIVILKLPFLFLGYILFDRKRIKNK